MRNVDRLDLDLLEFCREDCGDDSLHAPHGPAARTVRVARGTAPPPRPGVEVSECLVQTVLCHIGSYVPIAFADLWTRVRDDYGSVSDRSVQRALLALLAERSVASLGSAAWAAQHQRSTDSPGFYIRYDSPKLWSPGGLRDLMSVVADNAIEQRGPRGRVARDREPHRYCGRIRTSGGARIRVNAPHRHEVQETVAALS